MFIQISVIGLFIVLGIIFSMGKGSFLIAGFNTMSTKEKEKYDRVSLCKFMGKYMFTIAFSSGLFLLSDALEIKALFNIGIALFSISTIFILIYVNTGNRLKK